MSEKRIEEFFSNFILFSQIYWILDRVGRFAKVAFGRIRNSLIISAYLLWQMVLFSKTSNLSALPQSVARLV